MNIAITSQGEALGAQIDPRFGRSTKFIIFDTETEEFAAIDNAQNLNAPQGAGIQTAQNIVNTGSKAVITGNCGPKAFRVLSAASVKVYAGVTGTVEENITKFTNGELVEMSEANVEVHW